MRAHDWFQGLPSWAQQDKSWYDLTGISSRPGSLASVAPSTSVGASTKRRSRADAMRCLEGRSQSKISDSSEKQQSQGHTSMDGNSGDSENGDAWSDPWADITSSGSPGSLLAASSIYSGKLDPPLLMPGVPGCANVELPLARQVTPLHNKACHDVDHIGSSPSHPILSDKGIGATVKAALRLSSQGSVSSSVLSEPKVPPAVHLSKCRRTPLSVGRPHHDFWPPQGHVARFPDSPYLTPTAPYIPLKNARISPARDQEHLGWVDAKHQPDWTRKVSTPRKIYHQIEHRPTLDKSTVLCDVEMDQQTVGNTCTAQRDFDVEHCANGGERGALLQAIADMLNVFNCFTRYKT